MNFLISMPRETDTSLFKDFSTHAIFIAMAVIGIILAFLVFRQNYKDWSYRRKKIEEEKADKKRLEAINRDLFGSSLVSFLVVAVLSTLLLFIKIGWF